MKVKLYISEEEIQIAVLEFVRRRHEDLCTNVSAQDVRLCLSTNDGKRAAISAELALDAPAFVHQEPGP